MRAHVRVVIAVLLFLCACSGSGGDGGSSTFDPPRDSTTTPLLCNSRDGGPCPEGYRCADNETDSCDPATGEDCGGFCVLGEELARCGRSQGPCPEGSVCVDDPTDACPSGPATDCPSLCRPEATGGGDCTDDSDCPALPAVCNTCADGSFSCPTTRCDAGKCIVDGKPCPEPTICGGAAGLPCEPGLHCVDNPNDECVPERNDANCRGICVPGEEPLRCGGSAGTACPEGYACVEDPSDSCEPQNGGADCPGLCEQSSTGVCRSDADCPPSRAPCSACPDNNEVCPKSFCDNGQCGVILPSCASPVTCGDDAAGCGPTEMCVDDPGDTCDPAIGATGCKGVCVPILLRPCGGVAGESCPPGFQCVVADGTTCDPNGAGAGCVGVCTPFTPQQCQIDSECAHILLPQECAHCPGSSFFSCPRAECTDGICSVGYEPCPAPEECRTDDDCKDNAIIQGCSACPDSPYYSCPRVACTNGACLVEYEPCSVPDVCGGVAGLPCAPGLICVDDPNDECDPLRGGADCAGICVREEKPAACGGITGQQCPAGYECTDDPGDDCDPASGGADCPGFCRPAPLPPCATDSECPRSLAPCLICADGSAACPRSYCVNGACKLDFETCGAER